MALQFTKATKTKAKLRLALFGPSGSGKTYTALRLAAGLGGRVALIDSERGSASKYADRFDFDTVEPPKCDIKTYVEAISLAAQAGYDVLIIDSLTHAWHELLDEVERVARSKFGGNTWSAWSEGTPKQRGLVDALLGFPGHVIATMRTKTEWTLTTNEKGKSVPVRIGLAPEQGKGIEYEFDLLMEIGPEHVGIVTKDRTGRFQDQAIDKPGEEMGRQLLAWLSEGADPAPRPVPLPAAALAPAANGKPKRPLAPDAIRATIRKKAGWQGDGRLDSEPLTEPQAISVPHLLGEAVKREGITQAEIDTARHATLAYLLGVESTARLTKREASAIIDWLKEEGTGWGCNGYAPAEVAGILAAWQESQGQGRLDALDAFFPRGDKAALRADE